MIYQPKIKVTHHEGSARAWETFSGDDAREQATAWAEDCIKVGGSRCTAEQSYLDDDGNECWESFDLAT